ncbi:MOSC domain-containing protein [Hypoxylon sp. FL1284]|nr:MOSC domain-containing protein [Hypoxylon sp. FL1284]
MAEAQAKGAKIQITELYIYPIKSLRPISLRTAQLRREGLRHDRRFMLLKVADGGGAYDNVLVSKYAQCALFAQALDDDASPRNIVVTYRGEQVGEQDRDELRVPLEPAVEDLETVDVDVFGSPTRAFRVGETCDAWFSARLGFPAVLVYIGDNRRSVLAHAPPSSPPPGIGGGSWHSSVASFLLSYLYQPQQGKSPEKEGGERLVFNEAAPFLLTSWASLRDVSARLRDVTARMPDGAPAVDMVKFRPNIVVDQVPSPSPSADNEQPVLKAWDEDFWGEVAIGGGGARRRLALTANCGRCVSIDVNYATGRRTDAVLRKLMRDRRVDPGNKWSPVFGRYAFLLPPQSTTGGGSGGSNGDSGGEDDALFATAPADVAVGDEVEVTRRLGERDVWAWPE